MIRLMSVRLSAALAVVVMVAVGGTGRTATPSPQTLLARHAPVIVLHPQERFQPVPVDGFLADSDVKQRQPDGTWGVVPGPLPATAGPWRLDQRLCDVRDGLAATDCYAAAEAAHGAAPTVYGAAFVRGARIALQYWLFYPFNPYSPEVPPNPEFAQLHEGDWELVTVITSRGGTPATVAYSRHCAGARREWRRVERRGARPVVYVALGSHAGYFRPGAFALEKRCWPAEAAIVFDTYKKQLRDFAGQGRSVRPRVVPVTTRSPAWMRFPGTWGEDQIIDFPDARFTYKAGPAGPAFHDAWRQPFAEALSWPEG